MTKAHFSHNLLDFRNQEDKIPRTNENEKVTKNAAEINFKMMPREEKL